MTTTTDVMSTTDDNMATTDDNMATTGERMKTIFNQTDAMNSFEVMISTVAKTLGIVDLAKGVANKFDWCCKISYLSHRHMFTAMVANT